MPATPAPTTSPLPPGPPADGVPGWGRVGAAAWSAAGPGRWARPLWTFLALLVTVGAAVVTEPVPLCADAAPCGPEWIDAAQTGLAIGLLCWNARLPELTLLVAPVLAGLVAAEQFPAPGAASRAANLAVLAALGLGWAAARERVAARRRQRLVFERASGAVLRTLDTTGFPRRGKWPLIAGTTLCAVALGATLMGQRGVHADEDRAARATRVEAEVTSRADDSVRLRAPDGRRLVVASAYPEDHRLGATVTVLEDGSWCRLAAEPYDAFGPQLLALVTGVPGIFLAAWGLRTLRRSAALRRAGLPALRVRAAMDGQGMLRIHGPDATGTRKPLFVIDLASADRPDDEERSGAEDDAPVAGAVDRDDGRDSGRDDDGAVDGDDDRDDDGDDDGGAGFRPRAVMSLRDAVLIGAPYEDAELALVPAPDQGHPHPIVLFATARLVWGEGRSG
ncbi:hypothetical protein ACFVU3_32660 [Streptomyces sp. NPDC058052]|uniref:hypothetical protein n=1 Tax=Streptomyces sp. NPDC058052 TaxID=3346316 RepID=UPI0036EBC246